MHPPTIVVKLGERATRAYQVDLIFPCNDDGIVPAPLKILGGNLGSRVVLTQAGLEVAGDDMGLAGGGVQGKEFPIGRDGNVGKGPNVQEAVLAVRGIRHIDSLSYAEEHLDGAREGVSRRDDVPGVDLALGGRGQELGAGLVVGRDRDQGVVSQEGNEAVGVEAAGLDAGLLGAVAQGELGELALQVVVAADGAVGSDD